MMDEYPDSVQAMLDDGPTCTILDFMEASALDPQLLWRVDKGHVHNLLEEALDLVEHYVPECAYGKVEHHRVMFDTLAWCRRCHREWPIEEVGHVQGA